MILGSIKYRGETILDFSPRFVIGSQSNHVAFDSLDSAMTWVKEFKESIQRKELKRYARDFGLHLSNDQLDRLQELYDLDQSIEFIINDYFYEV
jgi:hypothetical protein